MRLTRILLQDIAKLIQRYSRYQQSCLSIEQFTSFGEYYFDITDQSCNSIPCNLNYLLSSFVKDQNQQQNIVLTLKLTLQRRIFRVFLADTVANSIMCECKRRLEYANCISGERGYIRKIVYCEEKS